MKLSIITCTYNSDKFLQECINSVIAQNLDIKNYEHIFVDAYSTDNTKQIIKNYMGKNSNVKLIERKPKWVYNAMNQWAKEARWEYIMFLNSDDWLAEDVLKKYLDHINWTWDKDIYYWKVCFTKDKKNHYIQLDNMLWIRKFLFFTFWSSVLVTHPSTLSKRDLFEWDIWYFDENKKIASDYWFFLKCLNRKKQFCYFPEVVTYFRVHDWSLSTNWKNKTLSRSEWRFFKRKYLPLWKAIISWIIDRCAEFYWKLFW